MVSLALVQIAESVLLVPLDEFHPGWVIYESVGNGGQLRPPS